ncbi:hypothetical protein ABE425_10640 [Chryseobacterium cucumeris]|uniref:hypothetical protein n=1 Tax=Chryseobacterium cucumeris TaxID=1813611 RepID=UPI003207A444
MKTLAQKQSAAKLLTEEFWSTNEILNQPVKIEHSVNIIDKNGIIRYWSMLPVLRKPILR